MVLLIAFVAGTAEAQTRPSRSAKGKGKEPAPEPVRPAPLPELPPPLAEQALPYSIRFIDRPYTPPKGLHDLSLTAVFAHAASLDNQIQPLWYLSDFEYRQPLTSDISLIWNPIPLGVQYQPKRTETTVTGVSWSIGWQYLGNIGAKPQFTGYMRRNLSASKALEMQVTYFTLIPFDSASSVWHGSYRIGPLFQQTDRLAISPKLGISNDNIPLERAYRRDRTPIEDKTVISKVSRVTFPFSFWIGYAASESVDVIIEYTLFGSTRTGTYVHLGTLGLTTRW